MKQTDAFLRCPGSPLSHAPCLCTGLSFFLLPYTCSVVRSVRACCGPIYHWMSEMFSFGLNSCLTFHWAHSSWSTSHVLKTLLCSLGHLLLLTEVCDRKTELCRSSVSTVKHFLLFDLLRFHYGIKYSCLSSILENSQELVSNTNSTFLCIPSSWNSQINAWNEPRSLHSMALNHSFTLPICFPAVCFKYIP